MSIIDLHHFYKTSHDSGQFQTIGDMMNWTEIVDQITASTGEDFQLTSAHPLAGGDINTAYRLEGKNLSYFVKLNRPQTLPMFIAEAAGLEELSNSRTIRVPKPCIYGATTQHAFLVLEYIEFGTSSKSSSIMLGRQLALLHQERQPYFGWHRDNTIGSTPQPNAKHESWQSFWLTQRLRHQLNLAATHGYRGHLQTNGMQLCEHVGDFFRDYQPHPSLLHGDLWGGNAESDKTGNPVIFDPACYYGDREADLAMTELFGGFDSHFYAAYRETYPLDPGYVVRKTFYNLYHILNHLNLFGSGYLGQSENMILKLLSEVR